MSPTFALFCAGVTLAECLILFVLLWLGFRLFKGSTRVRNWMYLVLSYPGLFSLGGGTVGFAVPVPLLLGAPVWAITLGHDPTSGTGWFLWRPAPLVGSTLLFEPPWLSTELAMMASWLVVALVVMLSGRRPNRPSSLDAFP